MKAVEQTKMYIKSLIDSGDAKLSLKDGMMFYNIFKSKIDFLKSLLPTEDEMNLFLVVERIVEV